MRTPQADGPLTQARLRLKNESRQRALQAQQQSQPSVTELVARVVSNPPQLPPVATSASSRAIPLGWCQCGCGVKTRLAPKTRRELGHVKGQPLLYIPGHNDATGRGRYSLRPETVREAQRLAEEQEAKAAAEAAKKSLSAVKPANQPAPFVAPVVLPAATGIIGGRGVNFYSPIGEREPSWSRHHDSASSNRRPARLNYSGYGTRRRP